jgi:RNA polymerase I-specific transcription initiation factor RRN7
VLRKQAWWLVHEQKLPAELETVVRDLWDLRIRNFAGLRRAAGETDAESGAESGVDSGTELFSSQAGSESDASTATTRTTASRARSWTSESGQDWNLPGLFHCLALCYLACLSLSLPVRVGHIYNWAKNGQLLFLGALDEVPGEMTLRLPGSYHRALLVKHTSFQGGELHQAVLELILEYHLNYDMVFPPLNTPLLLLHYLRELALPGTSNLAISSETARLTCS